jgi:hypothetical protein
MGAISGVKLLSAAMVFGLAAVIFTAVPFLLVIIRGIAHSRNNSTGGGNFLSVVIFGFIIHAMSTIFFMLTILILDIFSRVREANFFSTKVIPIFWAKTKNDAFALAGISPSSPPTEALGAWTMLLTVKTVVEHIYLALPLVVMAVGIAYGVSLSTKDTYRQDYLTVLIYSGVSMTFAMLLYTAWALIATQGLFLPAGTDGYENGLLGHIAQSWGEILSVP